MVDKSIHRVIGKAAQLLRPITAVEDDIAKRFDPLKERQVVLVLGLELTYLSMCCRHGEGCESKDGQRYHNPLSRDTIELDNAEVHIRSCADGVGATHASPENASPAAGPPDTGDLRTPHAAPLLRASRPDVPAPLVGPSNHRVGMIDSGRGVASPAPDHPDTVDLRMPHAALLHRAPRPDVPAPSVGPSDHRVGMIDSGRGMASGRWAARGAAG